MIYLYEVKVFIEEKEVKKIDDQQRKVMLEKALSNFHKKNIEVTCKNNNNIRPPYCKIKSNMV